MFSKVALAVLAAAPAILAAPATPLGLALVKQQFVQSLITPTVVPTFDPTALLNVSFPATDAITTGQAVSMADAGPQPTISVAGADGAAFDAATRYTVVMIDGDIAGSTNPEGVNAHYIQNNLALGPAADDEAAFNFASSEPTIAYAGPGPAAGSGPHRYIVLVFAQPAAFNAPASPAAGSSVTPINFPEYLRNAGLTAPIAGTYFTVEVGTSTVTPSATFAVDTATLSVPGASSSGASSPASRSSATSSSAPTATQSGAAMKNGAGAVAMGAVALALGALMA